MPEERKWTRADLPPALNGALEAAIERGARVPVVLRLTEIAGYTDWALLLSARSDRQVRGVVEGIREATAKLADKLEGDDAPNLLGVDGLDLNLWALLDYDDFLVHVFYHPVRRHYDLESMWSDAPRVDLGLPDDILDASDLDGLTVPDPMPEYHGDMDFGGFEDEFVDDDDDYDDDGDEFVDDDAFGDGNGADFDDPKPEKTPADPTPDSDLFEA